MPNEANPVTRTVKVQVRHSADCPDRRKGTDWRQCRCRKALIVYEGGGTGANRRISAKTRSWARAERAAQEYLDQFDPDKVELKQLRAQKERQQVPIEDAVALYISDMVARLGDGGTVAMARSLLAHMNADRQVTRAGHLFNWINQQTPRPVFISDLTATMLTTWRASWGFGDLTSRQRWTMVKVFFSFCEAQGWIDDSPARKIKSLKVRRGNRTAIFTDEQYTNIFAAVNVCTPAANVPTITRKNWQERLATFLELMRWSGADLIDAVQYSPSLVGSDGVLRYRRQKTGVLAVVPLPDSLVIALRDVPLERDSIGTEQPFRQTGSTARSDTRTWSRRLEDLFTLAGITTVTTDQRTRKPHCKMLRDTFAVWHLRHGASIHTVSKMLGHATTMMTEKAYLPWVKELEVAHIADARKSLAKAPKPKPSKIVSMVR